MELSNLDGKYLFTTGWCGPCKTIKARLGQREDVVIVDAEEETELVNALGIKAVPHLIVAEAGEIKQSLRGPIDIEPVLFPKQ